MLAMLVMRRAESDLLRGLTTDQTDDLLKRLYSDKAMPGWARALARAPWLYRQAPVDIIPDFIPFIGKIDDKLVTSFSLGVLSRLAPRNLFESHVEAFNPKPPVS